MRRAVERTRVPAVAVGAVAALLLAGCGGGDSGVRKADYVREANTLCRKGNSEVRALGRPDITNLAKLKDFAGRAIGIVQRQLDELQALEAPKADRDRLEDLYADAEALVQEAGSIQQAKTPAEVFQRFTTLQDGMDDINERLNDYGLVVCGQSDDGADSS